MCIICSREDCFMHTKGNGCFNETTQRIVMIKDDGSCDSYRSVEFMLNNTIACAKAEVLRAEEQLEKYKKTGETPYGWRN